MKAYIIDVMDLSWRTMTVSMTYHRSTMAYNEGLCAGHVRTMLLAWLVVALQWYCNVSLSCNMELSLIVSDRGNGGGGVHYIICVQSSRATPEQLPYFITVQIMFDLVLFAI